MSKFIFLNRFKIEEEGTIHPKDLISPGIIAFGRYIENQVQQTLDFAKTFRFKELIKKNRTLKTPTNVFSINITDKLTQEYWDAHQERGILTLAAVQIIDGDKVYHSNGKLLVYV